MKQAPVPGKRAQRAAYIASVMAEAEAQHAERRRVHQAAERLRDAAPDLKRELEQARIDIGILLANLRYLEEISGESLEDEDAAMVLAIEQTYGVESAAITKATAS